MSSIWRELIADIIEKIEYTVTEKNCHLTVTMTTQNEKLPRILKV